MLLRMRSWVSLIIVLLVGILLLALPNDLRQAQAALSEAAPSGWGDEGIKEVGVEWINDFPGTDGDRSHWDESCDGLWNGLTNAGWTSRFHYTDWSAWESDFTNSDSGGSENTYVDSVDIAMLCTHGSGAWDSFWSQDLSSVYFGSTHNDNHLSPGEAYNSYGDKDLEFLAFDSCSVLSDGGPAPYYNRGYWAATMNGLHLLLGFNNTMYVWAPGDGAYWTLFMQGFFWLPTYNVTQAWFQAVDYNQPSVTCARVLAEIQDNYNDHLYGYGYLGSDPPLDNTYWYWDHCSSDLKKVGEMFDSELKAETLEAVPIFKVVPRTVDEDYVRQRISPAFFEGGYMGEIGQDDLFFYIADYTDGMTVTLQVAKNTGGFNYRNLARLWVPPETPPELPDEGRAVGLVEAWFKNQGEGLPGIWERSTYQYMIESLVEDMRYTPGVQYVDRSLLASIDADVYLNYGRTVSGPVKTVNGTQMADYQVVGPGSQLKIYLTGYDSPVGAQGGTRDVEAAGTIELLPVDVVWQMFLDNHNLAIPEVPYIADTITYKAVDFGYYELPLTQEQQYLIPVYIYLADFSLNGQPVASDVVIYVPAAEAFMPPIVTISDPLDGSTFSPDTLIQFKGSATGGTSPYTFVWSSSNDGVLGSGDTVEAPLTTALKGGSLFKHIIELQVTDANGLTGTATIEVYINGETLLPFVVK